MGKIETFQELQVWKDARKLASRIYELTRKTEFSKDFGLKDQIRRSTGSVMDNIAEGFERQGNKEFVQFLFIAKGSCGEIQSQLCRAYDVGYLEKEELDIAMQQVISIGKQLTGFIHYLKSSDMKGSKFVNEPEVPYVAITNYESRITNYEC